MMVILAYLLVGVIALYGYTIIAQAKLTNMPVTSILKCYSHVIVFVLLWPIDLLWCLYSLHKRPEEMKEGINEFNKAFD